MATEEIVKKPDIGISESYKYGFHDDDAALYKSDKGLNEKVVAQISEMKGEPDWMRDLRLKAFRIFESISRTFTIT